MTFCRSDRTAMLDKVVSIFRGQPSKARRNEQLRSPAYVGRHKGQDFLIIATGPSLREYQDKIREFIAKVAPVVMAGNFIDNMFVPHYHAFVNRKRFCNYAQAINPASKVLLSPHLPKKVIRRFFTGGHEEIAFENLYPSAEGNIRVSDGIVYAKGGTIATILMGVAVVMGARNIYVAGLDGYSRGSATHHYPEIDNKPLDDLLVVERCTKEQLACVRQYLHENEPLNGNVFIITPTVYDTYYKAVESFLR